MPPCGQPGQPLRHKPPTDPQPRDARASQADWKGNVNAQLGKVRDYARSNPSKVLGGLAALAIGAGLMRGRKP